MRRTLALSFVAALALSVLSAGTLGPVAPATPANVAGVPQFTGLYAHVETALSADVGSVYFELYDGTISVDVTDSPGPSFASLGAGTFAHKIDDATVPLDIQSAATVAFYEDATKFGLDPVFTVTAKDGVATYMRVVYSGTGTSGSLHVHGQWEPRTEAGFVESQ